MTPKQMTRIVHPAGFTLTELMVVVSLISIASAFAYSTLISYNEQFRTRGAAFLIATEMQRARMEAVRTRLCHFWDRQSSVQFRVVRDNPAAPDCVMNSGDTTLRTINLVSQYPDTMMNQGSIETDPFGGAVSGPSPTSMRFEPRGIVTTTGGSTVFVKGLNSQPVAVTVTAAGVVRTWRKDGSGWH